MIYKIFDIKTRSRLSVNEKLAEDLHQPIVKKFKGRKVSARFKLNIRAADLAGIESLSFNN